MDEKTIAAADFNRRRPFLWMFTLTVHFENHRDFVLTHPHKLIFVGCIYIFSAGWQNFWPIYSPNNASRGSSVKTDLGSTEDPKHLGLPKNSERAIRNLIPTIFHMFTTFGLYKIHGWRDWTGPSAKLRHAWHGTWGTSPILSVRRSCGTASRANARAPWRTPSWRHSRGSSWPWNCF